MISLPPAFTERMQQLLGNESGTFFQALVSESPTSIRLNPEKTANTDLPFSELLSLHRSPLLGITFPTSTLVQ